MSEPISVEVESHPTEERPPDAPVQVSVEAPVTVEPPAATPPAPDSGVQVFTLEQMNQLRDEMEQLRQELDRTRDTAIDAQVTAEQTAEVVASSDGIASAEVAALASAVDEIAEEVQPPDIRPRNSHAWFRSKDEWRGA